MSKKTRFMDGHMHVGKNSASFADLPDNEIVERMNQVGQTFACVSHFRALAEDWEAGNEDMMALAARHSDHVGAYLVVSPHALDDLDAYLDKNLRRPGVVGVKLHTEVFNVQPTDDRWRVIYEYCHKNNVLVLNHDFGPAAYVDSLSVDYRNMIMLAGHALGRWTPHDLSRYGKQGRGRRNLYHDTAVSNVPWGAIEAFTEVLGSHRIVFGTDMPFLDPAYQIGRLLQADISDADKEAIFARNLQSILSREVS